MFLLGQLSCQPEITASLSSNAIGALGDSEGIKSLNGDAGEKQPEALDQLAWRKRRQHFSPGLSVSSVSELRGPGEEEGC